MYRITKITLQNFRCFAAYQVDISHQLILIQGPNGTGKTSLLEALYSVAFAKSFRTSDTQVLRTFNHPFFSVLLSGTDQFGDTWESRLIEQQNKKELFFNNKKVKTFREILSKFRIITAIEEELAIITDGPEHRRTFIDKAQTFQNSSYLELLQTQKKILVQKNALLKSNNPNKDLFELWSQKQDAIDEQIRICRTNYLKQLITQVKKVGNQLKEETPLITAEYEKNNPPDNTTRWEREHNSGRILWGAHKDEITFTFNKLPARFYASRGQQKWILLLLKIAQVQLLSLPTILLFDDFLTDLDPAKAQKIIQLALKTDAQIFITAPESEAIQRSLEKFQLQVITLKELG